MSCLFHMLFIEWEMSLCVFPEDPHAEWRCETYPTKGKLEKITGTLVAPTSSQQVHQKSHAPNFAWDSLTWSNLLFYIILYILLFSIFDYQYHRTGLFTVFEPCRSLQPFFPITHRWASTAASVLAKSRISGGTHWTCSVISPWIWRSFGMLACWDVESRIVYSIYIYANWAHGTHATDTCFSLIFHRFPSQCTMYLFIYCMYMHSDSTLMFTSHFLSLRIGYNLLLRSCMHASDWQRAPLVGFSNSNLGKTWEAGYFVSAGPLLGTCSGRLVLRDGRRQTWWHPMS